MGKQLTDEQFERLETLMNALEKRDKEWGEQSEKLIPLLAKRDALLKAGEDVSALRKELEPELHKLHDICNDLAVLRKTLAAVERSVQGGRGGGEGDRKKFDSPGRSFARSEHWQKVKDHGVKNVGRGSGWQKVRTGRRFENILAKRAGAYDSDFAGALIQDVQLDRVVEFAKTPVIHRKYLNILPLGTGDTVKYSREKRELMLTTEVKNVALVGANQVDLEIATGLTEKTGWNTIVINGETHTITAVTVNKDGSGTVTIAGTLAGQADPGDEVSAPLVHFTGRGKLSPKSVDEWEPMTAKVKKLTTHVEAEYEILEDDDRTEDLIDRRLMNRYGRLEQKHVFNGNDATDGVVGFFNDPDIPKVLWSAMKNGSTKMDALLTGVITIGSNDYMPTAILANIQDFGDILGTKEDGGQYILWQIMLAGKPTRLWAAALEATTAVNVGQALVGNFMEGATFFAREEEDIEVGQPGNMFLEDMSAIKIRGRFAFVIEVPKAFCIVEFDAEPGAS